MKNLSFYLSSPLCVLKCPLGAAMGNQLLLLDDERDFGELTGTMLEFYDYAVSIFDDPRQALEDINQKKYDVIVTDLMMPHMNGFQVLESIRKIDQNKNTPVIVLTAKTLTDDERKLLFQNQAHFLIKPFEPHGLVDLIQKIQS
jgi:DNA-binding response OmpR family regulator